MNNIESIITEIAEGIKDRARGKKNLEIPVSYIKDSMKNEGIRWNNKYMDQLIDELKKHYSNVKLEEYKTHIVNKQQKNNNYILTIEC